MVNERIKQLAEQALDHPDLHSYDSKRFHEIFAETIIRECANVCYDHSNAAGGVDTHFGYGYKDCGDDIKRVFGVEE